MAKDEQVIEIKCPECGDGYLGFKWQEIEHQTLCLDCFVGAELDRTLDEALDSI